MLDFATSGYAPSFSQQKHSGKRTTSGNAQNPCSVCQPSQEGRTSQPRVLSLEGFCGSSCHCGEGLAISSGTVSVPSISAPATDSRGLDSWLCVEQFLWYGLKKAASAGRVSLSGLRKPTRLTCLPRVCLSSKYLVEKKTHHGVAPAGQEPGSSFLAFLSPHPCWFGEVFRDAAVSVSHTINHPSPVHPSWVWVKSSLWPVNSQLVLNINRFLMEGQPWAREGLFGLDQP